MRLPGRAATHASTELRHAVPGAGELRVLRARDQESRSPQAASASTLRAWPMVERFPLEQISWFLIADLTPIDCLPDLAAGFVPRSALSSPYYNRFSALTLIILFLQPLVSELMIIVWSYNLLYRAAAVATIRQLDHQLTKPDPAWRRLATLGRTVSPI